MCTDYRQLNVTTRRDHFPLPLIEERLNMGTDYSFFTFLMNICVTIKWLLLYVMRINQYLLIFLVLFLTNECMLVIVMHLKIFNYAWTIFNEFVKIFLEVFMNDFTIFCDYFDECLGYKRKCIIDVAKPIFLFQ